MRNVLALLMTIAPAAANAVAGVPQDPSALRYELRPVPRGDRTELEVTLRVRSDATTIGLPEDAYGTPELWRYVTEVEGLEGTVVGQGASALERTVTPSPEGEIRVRYRIAYDPAALERYAFAPSVGSAHFDVAGCQWLLRVGDPTEMQTVALRLVDLPEGWACFTSLAADARELEVRASYDDLVSSRIGAGAFAHGRFERDGRELSVFVDPALELPAEEVVDAVRRIVELQRARMGGGEPFFRVVVHAREGLLAGTAVPNLFVCFVQPEATRAELYGLLAHEMFHAWLPHRLQLALAPGESEIRHEWLYEGVADYAARKLLLDGGLIDADAFAESVNGDLRNLADNPGSAATYEELRRVEASGGWDTAYKKLAYDRGAVIALNWEARLRADPDAGDVVALLQRACAEAEAHGGELAEERLFDLAAERGLDLAGDLARHILEGAPILPAPDALGPDFELVTLELPRFDPGFDLRETFRGREVAGVRPDGPAAVAGVADGMGYVRIRNSNRFGNVWYADRPLELTVTSDGAERTFAFFPRGEARPVPQFRRRAGNPVIEGR